MCLPENVVPLLNNTTSTPSNTRPTMTKRPTFSAARDSLISKITFFRVGHAGHEFFHDRIIGRENLIGCASNVNFFVVQHQNPLTDPSGAAHVVSYDDRCHVQTFAHPNNQLIYAVGNDWVQTRCRLI